MPILRPLKLREIAHAIVSDKVGILEVLQKSGILISQEDEESIFRAVLENELNDKIKLLDEKILELKSLEKNK